MDVTSGTVFSGIQPIIGELLDDVDELAENLTARVAASEPPYLENNAESRRYLYDSCRANLTAILFHLNGTRPLSAETARAAGRLRAEQGIPLATVLRCYRFAVQLIWEECAARADGSARAELIDFTACTWSVIDLMSDALAAGYRETELRRIHADAEAHARLVRDLFDARAESPGRTLETPRALGLPDQASFAVCVAEADEPDPATATEAARELRRHGIASVWDIRGHTHLGLLCAPPTAELAAPVTDTARAFPARVGLSRPFTQPTMLTEAVAEARLALHPWLFRSHDRAHSEREMISFMISLVPP